MNKGFTLLELLIVIAIIGILASIVVVSVDDALKEARELREVKEGYYAPEGHETRDWVEVNYDYLLIDGGRAYIK